MSVEARDQPICRVRGLKKVFVTGGAHRTVIEHLDLDVENGEILSIVGKSGCGKSTLLRTVAGLVEPTSGVVEVSGTPVSEPSAKRAMVAQVDSVFPWYTVRQNVEYPLRMKRLDSRERTRRVNELIELIGIPDYADVYPSKLSGGMRKRVDVARAYAAEPDLLLMDEAFGSLDVITKEQMQVELSRLLSLSRTSCMFVTHDIEEAIFTGDRVAIMTTPNGRMAEIFPVPFPRPRSRELKLEREFQELRREVTEAFYSHG